MAGFDDITKKASDFVKSQKAQDALKSEKAEGISDKLLDGVAGFADRVTGGKHSDKIESARDAADKKIGTDGAPPTAGPARKVERKVEPAAEPKVEPTIEPDGRLRGKLVDPKR